MLSREEILKIVYKSKVVDKLATYWVKQGRISPNNKEDFASELMMIICELQEEKLRLLYENNQLEYYVVQIATNQVVNKYSTYNKTYNNQEYILVGDINNADENNLEDEGTEEL